MRRPRAPAVLAALATCGLVIAVALRPGYAGPAIEAYVLFCGALGSALLVRWTSLAFGPPTGSPLAKGAAGPRLQDQRPADLKRIERELEMATQTAFDTHYRLRPLLREIATTRLARRAVDLERAAGHAELLLGPEAWQLVRPDLEPPRDHHAPGAELATVERAVDALERLA